MANSIVSGRSKRQNILHTVGLRVSILGTVACTARRSRKTWVEQCVSFLAQWLFHPPSSPCRSSIAKACDRVDLRWAAFVRYAEAEHKGAFFRALAPVSGVLHCNGKIDGTPCAKAVCIDLRKLTRDECGDALPKLHIDHAYDLQHICDVWSTALPEEPTSWDEGLCGPLVAHLLFGVEEHVVAGCSSRPIWKPQLSLRCGNVKSVEGQRAGDFCHDVAGAHYGHTLRVEDLRWP